MRACRRAAIVVLLSLSGVLPGRGLAAAEPLPAWTAKIRQDHPRLFFNAQTWPAVRQRALQAERDWYAGIKAQIDRLAGELDGSDPAEPRDLGPQAAGAAFVYLVTEEPRYLALAKRCLDISLDFYESCCEQKQSVNWYSTSRVHATLAWDWLYNHLTDDERTRYMSRLVRVIDDVLRARPAIYRENMSGYNTGFYGVRNCLWFIGCTALGTGIETELVNEWLRWGYEENFKMLAHRRRACGDDGGGASPTLGYVFGAYPWAEQNFFYTWLSATGENIAPDWPHVAWLANYVLWNWIQAEPAPLEFGYGDTPHVTNRLHTSELYTHMANIRHLYGQAAPDTAALAGFVQQRLPAQRYSSAYFIYPFLLAEGEQTPPPLAFERLPRARHFETMGQVFMRSGTSADDTYCLFTCGGILSQHRHYDALNFVIYHRGFLALDSGTRYSEFENGQHLANYYAQTVAHNCVLIHQPGEPAAPYWGGSVEGNHGGQHKQLGSVLKAFETNDDFVYVAGDATACYQHGATCGEKCELAVRQLVFLPPNHFVICDRIRTTQPDLEKQWLIHAAQEPLIQDRTIRLDHGGGRMFCRTMLPADSRLQAIGGPGKEFWAAGRNWEIAADGLQPQELVMMGRWRVEVTPGKPRQEDVFLHVLQVGPQTLSAMDDASLLESPGSCGVRLETGAVTWEITFRTDGPPGGQIRRSGGATPLERRLTEAVQPQQGTMLQEPQS